MNLLYHVWLFEDLRVSFEKNRQKYFYLHILVHLFYQNQREQFPPLLSMKRSFLDDTKNVKEVHSPLYKKKKADFRISVLKYWILSEGEFIF